MDGPAPTIAELLLTTNRHLYVRCGRRSCGRQRRLSAVEAVRLLGPRTTIVGARQRLRCAGCGCRGREVEVWPCTLDESAWRARQEARATLARGEPLSWDLDGYLSHLQALVGDGELGGDGPVQWPPEGPSKPR